MKTPWLLRAVTTVGLLAGLVMLAGCTNSAAGSGEPIRTNAVTMPRSYRFAPEVIQVPAGTAVTWRNQDNFTHSVRLRDGSEPDHVVKPGERVTITFTQPGEYRYDCSLHPHDMHGTVMVTGS
jgi:plastocyanin